MVSSLKNIENFEFVYIIIDKLIKREKIISKGDKVDNEYKEIIIFAIGKLIQKYFSLLPDIKKIEKDKKEGLVKITSKLIFFIYKYKIDSELLQIIAEEIEPELLNKIFISICIEYEEISDHETRVDRGNLDHIKESEERKEHLRIDDDNVPEFLGMVTLDDPRVRTRKQHEYKVRQDKHHINETVCLRGVGVGVSQHADKIGETVSRYDSENERHLDTEKIYDYEIKMLYPRICFGVHLCPSFVDY
jgi:hypothetical protein